jgi:MYXO-CTERM domain-containing protein
VQRFLALRLFGLVVFAIFAFAPVAAAQREVSPGDDVEAAINALEPGDELIVHGGTYTLDESRFGIEVVGTEAMPIVIRAADGETPHFDRPNGSQNIWDIDNAEYVTIRGLEFSGGSAGLRVSGARFFTVEDCHLHDTGDVALRFNDGGARYEAVRLVGNHIHHTNATGEGMYLGCNDDGCQFFDGLIANNYIHHTNQATIEQGDGIEIKEGSYNNVIRDNVIHDTNYPCILTYSVSGNGGPNIIERNALWNCGDHGIQSAQDATIRNNIILSAGSDGIALQPHQGGSPSNHVIVNNTIIDADGTGISVRSPSGSVVIANNAIYTDGSTAISGGGGMVMVMGNVGTGDGVAEGDIATDFVMGHFDGGPPIDVFPADGSALVGAGVAMYLPADDFNGTARAGAADVGAYAYAAGGNPGWAIAEGFRDSAPVIPGDDAGAGDRDGGAIVPGRDSGVRAGDGGTSPPGSTDDGGCGCEATGGSGAGAALLAGLVMVLARRRRGS